MLADYQSLKMPDETRNYVPKLQAIKNIIANPKKYGLTLPEVSNTPYFTTIKKNEHIDVEVAAQLAEISVEEFKSLNAAHNRPVIRPQDDIPLLLPTNRVDIFNANLQAYKGRLSSWQTYQSTKGESYTAIAKKHGISLGQLRAINGLGKKQTRAVAQTLLVPATGKPTGLQLASMETSTPSAPTTKNTTRRTKGDVAVLQRQAVVRTHTIKKGETLYTLAKRYNTSVDELRKLNNLKGNTLAQGKKLRVPGTGIRG